jgi:nitroreductase
MNKITASSIKHVLEDLEKKPDSPFKMMEPRIRSGEFRPFYNAPALILILGPGDIPVLPIDCAILSGYFMLSAAARGLGTCFAYMGMSIADLEIGSELGIPEGYKVFGSLILGYPKEIPAMPPRNEPVILRVIS